MTTIMATAHCGCYLVPESLGDYGVDCEWTEDVPLDLDTWLEGCANVECGNCGQTLHQSDDHLVPCEGTVVVDPEPGLIEYVKALDAYVGESPSGGVIIRLRGPV